MKNFLEGFKGRFEKTEDRIHEFEDRAMESESGEQKETGLKKSKHGLKDPETPSNRSTHALCEFQKEKSDRKGQRDYLKK